MTEASIAAASPPPPPRPFKDHFSQYLSLDRAMKELERAGRSNANLRTAALLPACPGSKSLNVPKEQLPRLLKFCGT